MGMLDNKQKSVLADFKVRFAFEKAILFMIEYQKFSFPHLSLSKWTK